LEKAKAKVKRKKVFLADLFMKIKDNRRKGR